MKIIYSAFLLLFVNSIVSWKNKPLTDPNEYTVITLWSSSNPISAEDKEMLHQLQAKHKSTIKYFEHEWTNSQDLENFLKQNNIDLKLVSADDGLKFKRLDEKSTIATSSKTVTIVLRGSGSTYLFSGSKLNEKKLKEALGIWKFS